MQSGKNGGKGSKGGKGKGGGKCWAFAEGSCQFGSKCKYQHEAKVKAAKWVEEDEETTEVPTTTDWQLVGPTSRKIKPQNARRWQPELVSGLKLKHIKSENQAVNISKKNFYEVIAPDTDRQEEVTTEC